MHRDRKQSSGCQGLREGRGELFSGYRVSVLQDDKRSGDGLHNNVNGLPTTELYVFKWLRWQILCWVYFITVF